MGFDGVCLAFSLHVRQLRLQLLRGSCALLLQVLDLLRMLLLEVLDLLRMLFFEVLL